MIPDSPTMTVPMTTDEDGAVRIGNTRILLELVIHAYYLGETPEGIVDSYPSLTTADVYSVIGYYLNHKDTVDHYMRQRDEEADEIIKVLQANLSPEARDLRSRLRAHQERHAKAK